MMRLIRVSDVKFIYLFIYFLFSMFTCCFFPSFENKCEACLFIYLFELNTEAYRLIQRLFSGKQYKTKQKQY